MRFCNCEDNLSCKRFNEGKTIFLKILSSREVKEIMNLDFSKNIKNLLQVANSIVQREFNNDGELFFLQISILKNKFFIMVNNHKKNFCIFEK